MHAADRELNHMPFSRPSRPLVSALRCLSISILCLILMTAAGTPSSGQTHGIPAKTDTTPVAENVQDASAANPQEKAPQSNPRPHTPPADEKQATKVNTFTGLGSVSEKDYQPLTGDQRWHYYITQNFWSVGAYFGPLLSSVIDQASGEPPEWGGGMAGYGRRLASRIGTGIIGGTVQSAGTALLGQEPRYIQSANPHTLHRIGHAFLFTFVTFNNEGKKRIAFPSLASYYVSSMSADLWLPSRYTALGDGVRDGNRQVIITVLLNQFQEFWPDIRRLVFRRK